MAGFTKQQIDTLLAPGLVPADRVPHLGMRVTETWTKDQLFAWEEQMVSTQHDLYRAAFKDIKSAAIDIADAVGMDTMAYDVATKEFRRRFTAFTEERLREMERVVARTAGYYSLTAYIFNYYARLWMTDTVTLPEVRVNIPELDMQQAMVHTFAQVREQTGAWDNETELLYQMLGEEWRLQYGLEIDSLIVDLKRSLNAGLREGDSTRQLMRRVSDNMGISTDRRKAGRRIVRGPRGGTRVVFNRPSYRANFNRVQTISRTHMMDAANKGSQIAFQENPDIVIGMEHLTAEDERVCKICRDLDGHIYPMDEPFLPPSNTHPVCRCDAIAIVIDSLMTPEFAPPEHTFSSWLTVIQLAQVNLMLTSLLGLSPLPFLG
jgi:SPP1 gp7 family putative phage head morphogenesis protein